MSVRRLHVMETDINNTRNAVQIICKAKPITDYLTKKGHQPAKRMSGGKISYCCPLPDHKEKKPSFVVYTQGPYQNFYCFGCLHENELIWTENGLVRIGDIKQGDLVWDYQGSLQTVIATKYKDSKMIELHLSNSSVGIKMTSDHRCLVIDRESALQSIPGLYKYRGSILCHRNPVPNNIENRQPIKLIERTASDIKIGDWVSFPVILDTARISSPLGSCDNVRIYTKGPRVSRILSLPATPDLAWLYGMYLAEGSVSGNRVVCFSLHAKEKTTIADRIARIVKKHFGLICSINIIKNKCELYFCKRDLADLLTSTFGKGAHKKRVPSKVLRWPKNLQKEMLCGYQEGDGDSKNKSTTSVSRALSLGIFNLAIQCGERPFFSVVPARFSGGCRHSESYYVYFRKKNSSRGMRIKINDQEFYIAKVESVNEGSNGRVVDISVSGTETFLTSFCSVHNCSAKRSIIDLYSALEGISWKEALKRLSDGLDLSAQQNLQYDIEEFGRTLENNQYFADVDLLEAFSTVSSYCVSYLAGVNNDPEEVLKVDKLYERMDKDLIDCEFDGINDTVRFLPEILCMRKEKFFKEETERRKMLLGK